MTTNLRVRPNVFCRQYQDKLSAIPLAFDQIPSNQKSMVELLELRRRVAYWELRLLVQVYPASFPAAFLANPALTPRQIDEKFVYLNVVAPGTGKLWAGLPKLKPMMSKPPRMVALRPPPPPAPPIRSAPTGTSSPKKAVPAAKEEQKRIIEASLDENLIVLAPPGTGKTHTLIERLCHLISTGKIANPNREILALSFTRAAVAEIVKRVVNQVEGGAQDDLRYINVCTFDSFATSMLRKDLDSNDLRQGYQVRIKQFTQEYEAGKLPEATKIIEEIRYLLVDEIQDILGPRARMVLALMRNVLNQGGTVMLLGDPAQAIYDWSLDQDDKMTSDRFLKEVRSLLETNVSEVELSKYRRYTSSKMKEFVRRAREAVSSDGRQPDGQALEQLITDLDRPCPLVDLLQQKSGVAVLTRTNLQAFQVHQWCKQNDVDSEIMRGAGGAYWPDWIARLFLGWKDTTITPARFEGRWKKYIAKRVQGMNCDMARAFLEDQGFCKKNGIIDLESLSNAVHRRSPFQGDPTHGADQVIISTIHRSKGLEFDDVLVMQPKDNSAGDPMEIRTLYVAATRARRKLRILERDHAVFRRGKKSWSDLPTKLDHFLLRGGGKERLLLDGIDELEWHSILEEPEVRKCQEILWEAFASTPGEISLQGRNGRYEAVIPAGIAGQDGETVIGKASAKLEADLLIIGGRRKRNPNRKVTSVKVHRLVTVAFSEDDGRSTTPLGAGRLALMPLIQSLAILET